MFLCPVLVLLVCLEQAAAAPRCTLHKLGDGPPAVLVVGGIQGDEPGGFSAASLLVTHYDITSGAVWVVPNLNFPSIIRRSRGIHGDMNRKFDRLDPRDPEYNTVRRVQELIRTPGLRLVLNLHDGSGFYRPRRESADRGPQRWGQSVIIDGATMQHPEGDLARRAARVLDSVNRRLIRTEHALHLKNTRTAEGNPDMEKSLSWYAVRHGVPAFGLEASKNFSVDLRTYYHLLLVEAFLKQAGIGFKRRFPLSPKGIAAALQNDVYVAFDEKRVVLPLENVRPRIGGYIPLPKGAETRITASKPILAVTGDDQELCVHYGNRTMTRFRPEWHELDSSLEDMAVMVDGRRRRVKFGELLDVGRTFEVEPVDGYRVNAIGADHGPDESGRALRYKDFNQRFSLDRHGKVYRVETYRGRRFTGMFLVRFGDPVPPGREALPAVAGRESELGM